MHPYDPVNPSRSTFSPRAIPMSLIENSVGLFWSHPLRYRSMQQVELNTEGGSVPGHTHLKLTNHHFGWQFGQPTVMEGEWWRTMEVMLSNMIPPIGSRESRSRVARFGLAIALGLIISACGANSLTEGVSAERATTTTFDAGSFSNGDDPGIDQADLVGDPEDELAALLPDSPIFVDQFGYRPNDSKVAVISDPETGFNSSIDFTPGSLIELRSAADDSVIFEAEPSAWADGEVHSQSGDRGWWFDFSSVTDPGTYYVIDPASGTRTGDFEIAQDVYDEVLEAALKVFWFNRGNVEHTEEFGGPWNDAAAYVGPNQDTEARSVDNPDDDFRVLDLSGGWFDAGDPNKYVTFASQPVHLLLSAYQDFPQVFDDDLGIPESGNAIPDIVDEVRWETEWLERMQLEDGSVLTKVGVTNFGHLPIPSENQTPRFYEEECSSATIAAAGMFAHAALVFGEFGALSADAARLEQRAIDAWDWFGRNDLDEDCDPLAVNAGDADWTAEEQRQEQVVAAIYLYALTGDARYDQVIRANHDITNPFIQENFNVYLPQQGDALLFYRDLASADPATVNSIEARLSEVQGNRFYGFDEGADLYRSFMPDETYHWGSNRVKANIGYSNAIAGPAQGAERAVAHVNYFHGVNPLGLTYLSNTGDLGADKSVERLLHYWFGNASPFDVDRGSEIGTAPGYVVGGPNQFYSGQASPPADQPPQKSYRDFYAPNPEPVWEVTEPAIYYQASYIRLLSAVVAGG